eukprot:TRINITY_DN8385_c0_g1_i1.p1 TRINITY_DN8385_c0_g1~~TRINITY_DN8385_c0_g1_i1.p1  ORF type:complete len:485 (-),score=147.64 TRINITY_DN8385_c0_g1_i1:40-1410(-)
MNGDGEEELRRLSEVNTEGWPVFSEMSYSEGFDLAKDVHQILSLKRFLEGPYFFVQDSTGTKFAFVARDVLHQMYGTLCSNFYGTEMDSKPDQNTLPPPPQPEEVTFTRIQIDQSYEESIPHNVKFYFDLQCFNMQKRLVEFCDQEEKKYKKCMKSIIKQQEQETKKYLSSLRNFKAQQELEIEKIFKSFIQKTQPESTNQATVAPSPPLQIQTPQPVSPSPPLPPATPNQQTNIPQKVHDFNQDKQIQEIQRNTPKQVERPVVSPVVIPSPSVSQQNDVPRKPIVELVAPTQLLIPTPATPTTQTTPKQPKDKTPLTQPATVQPSPQQLSSLPQASLPQPPRPSPPQTSLPQPSLPQPSLAQPPKSSLPQPSLPQPSLPQTSLPQPSPLQQQIPKESPQVSVSPAETCLPRRVVNETEALPWISKQKDLDTLIIERDEESNLEFIYHDMFDHWEH